MKLYKTLEDGKNCYYANKLDCNEKVHSIIIGTITHELEKEGVQA